MMILLVVQLLPGCFVKNVSAGIIDTGTTVDAGGTRTKSNSNSNSNSINFIAIGDWGGSEIFPYTTHAQKETAKGMGKVINDNKTNENNAIDFVLALGDNFYSHGLQQQQQQGHEREQYSYYGNSNINTRFVHTFADVYLPYMIKNTTAASRRQRRRRNTTRNSNNNNSTTTRRSASIDIIPWYIIGGNHDHIGNISIQIDHTYDTKHNLQRIWNFPSLYHSHSARLVGANSSSSEFNATSTLPLSSLIITDSIGKEDENDPDNTAVAVTLDFIMIDTIELCGLNEEYIPLPLREKNYTKQSQIQWEWIEEQLASSNADYVVVAGHYPMYSVCSHGPTETLIHHLRPLLYKYGAHYLSGHDHCMVHYEEQHQRQQQSEPQQPNISGENYDDNNDDGDNNDDSHGHSDDDDIDVVHYVLSGMGDECCYKATNLDGNNTLNPSPGSKVLKWFVSHENQKLYNNVLGGFTTFRADPTQMIIRYHDHRGNIMYTANPIVPREKY